MQKADLDSLDHSWLPFQLFATYSTVYEYNLGLYLKDSLVLVETTCSSNVTHFSVCIVLSLLSFWLSPLMRINPMLHRRMKLTRTVWIILGFLLSFVLHTVYEYKLGAIPQEFTCPCRNNMFFKCKPLLCMHCS